MANCSQCGSAVTEGATFCPVCGTPQTTPAEAPAAAAPPPADQPPPGSFPGGTGYSAPPAAQSSGFGSTSGMSFDLKRLSLSDQIVGGATVLLFIMLFLPWYTVSFEGASASTSALGSGAGGYRFLILLLSIAIVGYLVVRALGSLNQLPLPHWVILGGAVALNALLTLLAFLFKPSLGVAGALAGVSVGWGFGAFLGLLCALAALGAVVWDWNQQGRPSLKGPAR